MDLFFGSHSRAIETGPNCDSVLPSGLHWGWRRTHSWWGGVLPHDPPHPPPTQPPARGSKALGPAVWLWLS